MGDLKRLSKGDMDAARNKPARETSSELKVQTWPELKLSQQVPPIPDGPAGVPPGRCGDSFTTFDLKRAPEMRPAYKRCRDLIAGKVWCAFLWGNFGNGKTHLAIAALNEWYARESTVIFWKVPDFLSWMRRRVFEDKEREDDVLQSYREGANLVVFDDLGTENRTDWSYEQLYRVLDSRSDNHLPTIITSNLDELDGRIVSRYREGLIVCRGKDQRA